MITPTTALADDEDGVLALAIAQSYLLDIEAPNWSSIRSAIEEAYRLGRRHARIGGTGTKRIRSARPKAPSKKAMVLGLLQRPEGVTMAQIAGVTGWQATTIRAFFSIARSKLGLNITSQRTRGTSTAYFVQLRESTT